MQNQILKVPGVIIQITFTVIGRAINFSRGLSCDAFGVKDLFSL